MNNKPQSSLSGVMKTAFSELMKNVSTSVPGHVLGFDPDPQTAQIQIGVVSVDVNGKTFTPPPLIECPVYFPGGSQWMIEYQIDPGDEGWVLFSQRCIDAWMQTGGVAQNPIMRLHDESDGCFFPGFRPAAKSISGFNNDGIRLRDASGENYVWLSAAGVTIKAANLNVDVGSGTVNFNSSSTTHNGVKIGDSHTHPQGVDSSGDTQQDTGGPK